MDYTEIYKLSLNNPSFKGANRKYYLFFDETNNPRKFSLKQDGFSFDEKAYFILGGVGFINNPMNLVSDIDKLFKDFKLQANSNEIKLKHLQGNPKADNLFELIKQPRVIVFLDWLNTHNDVFIHYSYLDNFYFSIVDIVDSAQNAYFAGLGFNRELKDKLYQIVTANKDWFIKLLIHVNYPDVDDKTLFFNQIIKLVEENNPNGEDFYIEYLRQILKSALHQKLPLLENNKVGQLVENYAMLYIERIYAFPVSYHLFDHECEIEKILSNSPITVYNQKVDYSFEDSKNNQLLQLSDLVVGILKYWFKFIEENNVESINRKLSVLSIDQLKTVEKLQNIMLKAIDISPAFKFGSSSNSFEKKVIYFLTLDFKEI